MSNVTENSSLAVVKNEHMQMMPIADAQNWYAEFVQFSKSILKPNLDFGVIPGTPKPTLYKPGAEKLRFVYGLGVETECIDKTVDIEKLFVDYSYRCTIRSKTGQVLSQCEGNCNSMEPKFGYVWKTINELPANADITNLMSKSTGKKMSEFAFAIDKGETTGQYGKPAEYWQKWVDAIESGAARPILRDTKKGKKMEAFELDETVTVYRITNPDVIGVKNTIMKMAQKRAFVGAILLATGASEFFTQDIEDMELNGTVYSDHNDVPFTETEEVKDMPPSEPAYVIAGHWYAKLEKCKTREDVDALAVKNKETLQAEPELKKLFLESKNRLPKTTTVTA